MSDPFSRAIIEDPLARGLDNSVDNIQPLANINPYNAHQSGGNDYMNTVSMFTKLAQSLGGLVGSVSESNQDTAITEGKLAFMQGTTAAEEAQQGNRYHKQGWETLNSADKANRWALQEQQAIFDGGYKMSPEEYRAHLMTSRAEAMKDLPEDPQVRKMYAASFDGTGPQLAGQHFKANNEYNKTKSKQGFVDLVNSTAQVAPDATRPVAGSSVRSSPGVVSAPLAVSAHDRDIGIRTMLAEAGGEGEAGMVAVGSVIKNRAHDGSYGGKTIAEVSLSPKQFSAWNSVAAGGNSPNKIDVNSPAYKKAGALFDRVMSGTVVDPTGGATQYFAPSGMEGGKNPSWNPNAAGIRIGNHVFSGPKQHKTTGTGSIPIKQGNQYPMLLGTQPGRQTLDIKGVSPKVLANWQTTQNSFGKQVPVVSGYRSEEVNKAAGGAEKSQHLTGNALDLDVRHLSNTERNTLIKQARANGFTGIGVYKTSLHLDMGSKRSWGGNVNASWAQDALNADVSGLVPTKTGAAPPQEVIHEVQGPQTQVQMLLAYPGLDNQEKTNLLADSLSESLASGTDQAFNDIGGMATLQQMGATPDELKRVGTAKAAYDKRKAGEFNVVVETQIADLKQGIESGKVTREQAMAQVTKMHDDNLLNDDATRSLFQTVAGMAVKPTPTERKVLETPELLTDIGNIYTAMRLNPQDDTNGDGVPDGMTADAAYKRMAALEKKYKLPPGQLANYMGKVADADQARKNKYIDDFHKSEQQFKENAQVNDLVDTAISNGYGLSALDGKVTGTDEHGNKVTRTAKELGVTKIQDDAKRSAQTMVKEGATVAEAAAWKDKTVNEALHKQGVVDEKKAQMVTSAFTGAIVDKHGKVDPDALEALDFAKRALANDRLGPAFLHNYAKTPQAEARILMAADLYVAGSTLDGAILKLSELEAANRGLAPDKRVTEQVRSTIDIGKYVHTVVKAASTDPASWYQYITGNTAATNQQLARQLEGQTYEVSDRIEHKANTVLAINPWVSPKVAVDMATTAVKDEAVALGDNLTFGNPENGTRLDQVMGIPRHKVTEATTQYMLKYGKGLWAAVGPGFASRYDEHSVAYWPNFTGRRSDPYVGIQENFIQATDRIAYNIISGEPLNEVMTKGKYPYDAQYDPTSKRIHIRMYQVGTDELLEGVVTIDAKTIGDEYAKQFNDDTLKGDAYLGVQELIRKIKLDPPTLDESVQAGIPM